MNVNSKNLYMGTLRDLVVGISLFILSLLATCATLFQLFKTDLSFGGIE